jgi:hypothetical protein
VEVIFVLGILIILALLIAPRFSKLPSAEKRLSEKEIEQIIVEKLGEEWRDCRAGDLVLFKDGRLCLVHLTGRNGISFFNGALSTNSFVRNFGHFTDVQTLYKRGDDPNNPDPEYLTMLDEFVQQNFGKRGG